MVRGSVVIKMIKKGSRSSGESREAWPAELTIRCGRIREAGISDGDGPKWSLVGWFCWRLIAVV